MFPDTQQGGAGGASGDPDRAAGDGTNDQEPPQKKRKPILTLKIERIFSEKGLPYLEREFPKLKFKGKGHEVSSLLVVRANTVYHVHSSLGGRPEASYAAV